MNTEFNEIVEQLRYHKYYAGSDGFIELVDVMGDESAIVDAARISYGKGTKKSRSDVGLIRYLLRHKHTSPFEMCELKFYIRCPMDTWRQWVRHRTANVNEYSTRYSEAINSMAMTGVDDWRIQSDNNKQGSGGFLPREIGVLLSQRELDFHRAARELYEERLSYNVAREQARKDLPLSNYTEAIWKIDLHNLMHFSKLRLDAHAQLEIREFSEAMYDILKKLYPNVMDAFDDYILNAYTFSVDELDALRAFLRQHSNAREFFENTLENDCTRREIEAFLKVLELK